MNEFRLQKYKLSMQNNCTPKENYNLWKILPVSRLNTIFFTHFLQKQTKMFGHIGFYICHTIA